MFKPIQGIATVLGRGICVSLFVIGFSGCAGYDVSLNDRLIHTPKELFTDYALNDRALHECVRQTLEYQKAVSPTQLSTLNCSGAGISNLAGLATFSAITHLKLSVNKLRNVDELSKLNQLQVLHLDENQIDDVSALSALPDLRTVNLSKNENVSCSTLESLKNLRPALRISYPDHCNL